MCTSTGHPARSAYVGSHNWDSKPVWVSEDPDVQVSLLERLPPQAVSDEHVSSVSSQIVFHSPSLVIHSSSPGILYKAS